MADILGSLSDIKDKIQEVADDVSTKAYKLARESKEKIDNSFSGKTKSDSEAKAFASRNKEMEKKMQLMGGLSESDLQQYQINEDGLNIDGARSAFSEIDENEYLDPIAATSKKISEQIEEWLYNGEEERTQKKVKSKPQIKIPKKGKKEKVEEAVKYDPDRLSKGRQLKNGFDNDIFDFKSKNALFSSHKVAMAKESVERFSQLDYIINAFAGDKTALSNVDGIINDSYSQRVVNVLRDNLDGIISNETAGKNIFLEVHGVDHTKIEPNFTTEKMVELCVLESQGVESLQFVNLNEQQLNQVNKSIRDKEDLGNKEFLYKNLVSEIIGKTREEKQDQIKLIEQKGHVQDSILFENGEDGEVLVYYDSLDGTKLIARQDERGEYIKGNERNIINAVMRDEVTRNEFEGKGDKSLDREIEQQRLVTTREATMNPLSQEELASIKREEEQAIAAHGGNPLDRRNAFE